MAPKRPPGEESGSEQGIGASPRPTCASGEGAPGEDIPFMEQVLLELSVQNEHARAEAENGQPPAAAPPAGADGSPPRPRTVRVERDSEFRTPEGVPSARAYLPAKTLPPGRTEPIDTETVRVSDPRKLPTVRLPTRERKGSSGTEEGRGRGPRAAALDDNAPTLRSASPLFARERPRETRRWVGWMVFAALAGVLVVALAARFRSSPARPSPSPISRASGATPPPSSTDPPPAELRGGALSSPGAAATDARSSSPEVAPPVTGTPPSSARLPARRKSDRWF